MILRANGNALYNGNGHDYLCIASNTASTCLLFVCVDREHIIEVTISSCAQSH